jgi:uncharacterized protein YecE (DUF72 family)
LPLHVGTSGFDYPEWVGRIYPRRLPASERLAFYATLFPAVELNATFYRLPTRKQSERWAAQVPPDFRFAVKASRYLTHALRLRQPEEAVERMLERIEPLGDRLGPVLVQLPPDLEVDADALDATLTAFETFSPAGLRVRIAVEPRHESWFAPEIEAILREHHAALCRADRRGERSPDWRTADWRYIRMHEGTAVPAGCYESTDLAALATRLANEGMGTTADWVFFNNDGHACAPANARTFSRLADHAGFDVLLPT